MKKIYILLVLALISSQFSFGQNLKKANNLFEKRAFLDAAELYLKEDPKSQEVYENLADCYYFNNQMKSAAMYYKILTSKYSENLNPEYIFKYAQSLKGIGNYKEADTWMAKYSQLTSSNSQNIPTLNYFSDLKEKSDISFKLKKINLNKEGSSFGVTEFNNQIVFASSKENGSSYGWNNEPYLDLFKGTLSENGKITNIQPFAKAINTKMHESNAVFTKDGKTMYFTRNNYSKGKKGKDKNKITHLKIYKASLIEGEWSNILELPFNSDNYSTEHPALSADEKQLFFASDMPGSIGSFDIFVVDILDNNSFSEPKNLGPKINTIHREQFPFVSENSILYFSSNGHMNLGGLDLFKIPLNNTSNQNPINLGEPLNSKSDDFAFSFNPTTEKGYFSSNRNNNGKDAIYAFTEIRTFYVSGFVKNKNNGELIPGATIKLFDTNGKLLSSTQSKNDASYSLKIDRNSAYKLKASQKLYAPSEVNFETDKKGDINKNILLELELYEDLEENIVVENNKTQIKIDPIYFDFDKWNIRPDAAIELNNIVETMKKFPAMKIEIGAHTDCRGPNEYNLMLSEKRAASVRTYLIEQGVLESNISSVGYGETQPLNHCIKEGICKEQEYDINRRCEFVIIN